MIKKFRDYRDPLIFRLNFSFNREARQDFRKAR